MCACDISGIKDFLWNMSFSSFTQKNVAVLAAHMYTFPKWLI